MAWVWSPDYVRVREWRKVIHKDTRAEKLGHGAVHTLMEPHPLPVRPRSSECLLGTTPSEGLPSWGRRWTVSGCKYLREGGCTCSFLFMNTCTWPEAEGFANWEPDPCGKRFCKFPMVLVTAGPMSMIHIHSGLHLLRAFPAPCIHCIYLSTGISRKLWGFWELLLLRLVV